MEVNPRYLSGRVSFKESKTTTLWKKHHRWMPIAATLTLRCCSERCEEGRQGIHTALSHSANAENVSDRDRRRQRTMAIRGRKLKPALQRILRLINIVDQPVSVYDQISDRNLNANVKETVQPQFYCKKYI